MASKNYAYYIRGSQIALVQEDFTIGSNWKSPVEAIANGLEIEYAYSPRYLKPAKEASTAASGDAYHLYNGWFVVDGYLTLGASFITFAGYSDIAVDSHILIEGSERWNGIHKVKAVQALSGTTHAGIQTYTRVSQGTKYFTDSSVTFVDDETITGVSTEFDEIFSASPGSNEYIWIAGSDSTAGLNNGLFSGWSFSGTTLTLSSGTHYQAANREETAATPVLYADASNAIYIYEAFRENGGANFYSGVDVMNDESDTIDLPEYLAKALVYYVKAKVAEDLMDIDGKEYFMREFRRIVEKHENSRIWGSRRIFPGPTAIR